MGNKKLDNSNISKHLGQTSQYKSTYDPGLLVREPRSSNREYLNIFDDSLPFIGSDTWNAYECSFILCNGRPVTGVVKLVYPCSSKYIVESKSIKLYMNSYNMESDLFKGMDVFQAITKFEETVSSDLSKLLQTTVAVVFTDSTEINRKVSSPDDEWGIQYYTNVDTIDTSDESFTVYTETPSLLVGETQEVESEQQFYSSLLKSNCRVTSQPDWGDVQIYIKSKADIDPTSILKYIISFRDECHFHEEICECIYKRLQDAFDPSELMVMCLYARRGGIDINPVRASSQEVLERFAYPLINPHVIHIKTSKQ